MLIVFAQYVVNRISNVNVYLSQFKTKKKKLIPTNTEQYLEKSDSVAVILKPRYLFISLLYQLMLVFTKHFKTVFKISYWDLE